MYRYLVGTVLASSLAFAGLLASERARMRTRMYLKGNSKTYFIAKKIAYGK